MSKLFGKQPFFVQSAAGVTLLLLAILPLVYVPGYVSYTALRYFVFGSGALILFMLTAWTWARFPYIAKTIFRSWPSYGLLAYLTVFVLVSFTSVDPAASFWSSFQRTNGAFAMLFVTLFAYSVQTSILILGRKFLYQLLSASIIGAVALSVLIMFFTYNVEGTWFEVARGGATAGNSSLAAAYILWNIFFGAWLFLKSTTLKARLVWGSAIVAMLLSPLFINWQFQASRGLINILGAARGATIGIAFAAVVALGVWLLLQPGRTKRITGTLTVAASAAAVIAGIAMLFSPGSLVRNKFSADVGDNRLIYWDIAAKAFRENPVLGWGPYTFDDVYFKFYNPHMAALPDPELWVDQAHNLVIETLANGGVVLLAALLAFFAAVILASRKAHASGRLKNWEAALLVGALAGWFLQAQFVFESILSLAMLSMAAAIAYAFAAEMQPVKTAYRISSTAKAALGATAVVAMVLFVIGVAMPFSKNNRMVATFNSPVPKRTAQWQGFFSGSPMGNGYDSALVFEAVQRSYERNLEAIRSRKAPEKKAALDELSAVGELLYSRAQSYNRSFEYALLGARIYHLRMAIAGDFDGENLDRGLELSRRALELSPTNPEAHWIAARINFSARRNNEARELLEKAFALEPASKQTNNLILNFAQLLKDDEYYQSSLERARQVIPNFQE